LCLAWNIPPSGDLLHYEDCLRFLLSKRQSYIFQWEFASCYSGIEPTLSDLGRHLRVRVPRHASLPSPVSLLAVQDVRTSPLRSSTICSLRVRPLDERRMPLALGTRTQTSFADPCRGFLLPVLISDGHVVRATVQLVLSRRLASVLERRRLTVWVREPKHPSVRSRQVPHPSFKRLESACSDCRTLALDARTQMFPEALSRL
jgi:hypothetical protein